MRNRYDRQILLEEIGLSGQEKLKASRVLVVGAGGLGCPVLTYLTCAGVGYIKVVDHDLISESNLNRQFLYGTADIGKSKVEVASKVLKQQNPDVTIEAVNDRLTKETVNELLKECHIVVDCVDNIGTRLLLNEACLLKNIPLIEGGVRGFYGFATAVRSDYACLECMGFKHSQPEEIAPVIGVTAGVIGNIEASECIRVLLGLGSKLYGKSLQYDGDNQTMRKIKVEISPRCKVHQSLAKKEEVE